MAYLLFLTLTYIPLSVFSIYKFKIPVSCIDLYISVSSIVYWYTYTSIQYPRGFFAIIRHSQLLFSSIQYHISVYIFQYSVFKYSVSYIRIHISIFSFQVSSIIYPYTYFNIQFFYSVFCAICSIQNNKLIYMLQYQLFIFSIYIYTSFNIQYP